jgi:cysteine desulfurase
VRSGLAFYIGAADDVAIGRNPTLLSPRGRLYLDHAATTPVLPEARAAMADALAHWANPSSPHADGRAARAALEAVRATIAAAFDWRHDVILTSGATEALRIACDGAAPKRRVLSATEHEAAVAAMGADAATLPVDGRGIVDAGALARSLDSDPALVAVQLVNNETGVIQPVDDIADAVRGAGGLLLADCAQAAGKIPLPDADFIAVSGHKFGGPPGIGALLVKDLAQLRASGGQERGYRRGTENLPATAGMAAALDGRAFAAAMPKLAALRAQLEEAVVADGGVIIGAEAPRIATIGAYAMPGVSSASQLVQFDLAGISVSAGSACSSGSMKASRILSAMGIEQNVAETVVRVSFGPSTGFEDVERFLEEWRRMRRRGKARAA